MTVVILMVLAIVVAGAAAAWVLRWGALKAAGAVGLLGATAMIVAMLASVSNDRRASTSVDTRPGTIFRISCPNRTSSRSHNSAVSSLACAATVCSSTCA